MILFGLLAVTRLPFAASAVFELALAAVAVVALTLAALALLAGKARRRAAADSGSSS